MGNQYTLGRARTGTGIHWLVVEPMSLEDEIMVWLWCHTTLDGYLLAGASAEAIAEAIEAPLVDVQSRIRAMIAEGRLQSLEPGEIELCDDLDYMERYVRRQLVELARRNA